LFYFNVSVITDDSFYFYLQEHSAPLKAMLEVITQYLLSNKQAGGGTMKNGDLDSPMSRPSSNRPNSYKTGLESTNSRPQYPTRVSTNFSLICLLTGHNISIISLVFYRA